MADKYECPMCKGEMELIETKVISDTTYKVLKCRKCHYQVARRS